MSKKKKELSMEDGIKTHPPAEYPPLSHRPAVFPVWCRETSSACWSRGSSSDPQRSRGPDPPQSPAGASRADSPSPWLPGRETVEMSAGRSHGANAAKPVWLLRTIQELCRQREEPFGLLPKLSMSPCRGRVIRSVRQLNVLLWN